MEIGYKNNGSKNNMVEKGNFVLLLCIEYKR